MFGSGKSIGLNIPAVQGNQFGKQVVSLQCKVDDILKIYKLDRAVQRQLDREQVTRIMSYIRYGLEGNDIYFSPILFSARGVGDFSEKHGAFIINMSDHLFLLDGQHRISAFESLKKQLEEEGNGGDREYEILQKLLNFPLSVQIYRNLKQDEERQLFTDINRNAQKVHKTLAVLYRSNDRYSEMVRDIIERHPVVPSYMFESRARYTRKKMMTTATLYDLAQMLNEGVIDKRKAIRKGNYNQYKIRTESFLSGLFSYSPNGSNDRDRSIMWQAKTIIAMAKFVYEVRKENPHIKIETLFKEFIGKLDWTHNNEDFRTVAENYNTKTKRYKLGASGRVHKLLSQYLLRKYAEVRAPHID